ncbi:MAG: PspC domain-containing protein [Methanoregulaceae archaeon]
MKRLYRSRSDRLLGGICGGLGTHFDTDPNLIRIIWIVLSLLSIGIGVIAYIAAWIIIPEEPEAGEIVPGIQD